MGQFSGNPVQVEYTINNDPLTLRSITPLESIVILIDALMSVHLIVNREYAYVNDRIQYKIIVKNIGTIDFENIYVSFDLDSILELEPNTISVNARRVEAPLNHIPLSNMKEGKKCEIIFTTKVIKSPFFQFCKIKGKATAYSIYNGENSLEVSSNIVETLIQKPYKSIKFQEIIKLPKVMPKINRVICLQVYLLNVGLICYRYDEALMKISFATELYYRDCNMQKRSYYQTFERYALMKQTISPYVVCVSALKSEIQCNHCEINVLVGISIYNRVCR